MNRKAVHRPIEAVGSADVTRYVLARWSWVYTRDHTRDHLAFVWRSHIVYKLAYSRWICMIIIITVYQ